MNMMTHAPRTADHPIDAQFLNRHSPRAFTDRAMTEADVLSLLEAARWAPSAANKQPWRFAWALRGEEAFGGIVDALAGGNQPWAAKAAALIVVGSNRMMDYNGTIVPNSWAPFDAGAAWMSLALQASFNGWIAHGMGGFDAAKAGAVLGASADYDIHAVIAVGEQGAPDQLPEGYRPLEAPNGRNPVASFAGHGRFV